MQVDTAIVKDVVVVVPGIMGSELWDEHGNPIWAINAGALGTAIRTFGKSIKRLTLEAGIKDEPAPDKIHARGLAKSLHVIPGLWTPIVGYDGLLDFLRSPRFHFVEPDPKQPDLIPNLIPFAYDWRLSNRYSGCLLAQVATNALKRWRSQPGFEDAKLILICHSMGGLVARWFAEQEGGAPDIRAIVTIGTPHRGSLKAFETLVNGLEPNIGPLHLSLTKFARSLPSLHQLLPQYDCIVTHGGERTKRTNIVDAGCPGLDRIMTKDAADFHKAIAATAGSGYRLHKVVGIRQPTPITAAVLSNGKVEGYKDIDGQDDGGDGTVPQLAAQPEIGRGLEVHTVAKQHGELQESRSVLDLVDGIITGETTIWAAVDEAEEIGIDLADYFLTGDKIELSVPKINQRLHATIHTETGAKVAGPVALSRDGIAIFDAVPEGAYRVKVASAVPGGARPVSKPILVFDPHKME